LVGIVRSRTIAMGLLFIMVIHCDKGKKSNHILAEEWGVWLVAMSELYNCNGYMAECIHDYVQTPILCILK
jgi:hypothetical protein